MEQKQRLIGLDILRAIAIVSVVAGHFFSINTPFNDTPVESASMVFQGFLKALFSNLGVPMFLILSGYLCSHKTLSKSYYIGLIRVLYSYVIISVITWTALSDSHKISELFFGIINYRTIHYAWYIEMYIGLFLLIPFINIVLHNCFENKQKSIALMATMIFLFSLPATFSRRQFHFLPSYWQICFPILCYSIGAYIKQFQPVIHYKASAIVFALLLMFVSPTMELIYNNLTGGGNTFPGLFGPNYSIVGLFVNYVVFALLYKKEKFGKLSSIIITKLAIYSLNIYLFSYLFDQLIYPYFISRFYTCQEQFILFLIPIVVLVIVCSLFSSVIVDKTFDIFKKIVKI